ncbi:MAG: DedA family protein [Patescibacteria group bacterium]
MSFLEYLNPEILIRTFGLIGFFAVIFAESGLFFGFFLPGDSLLFTAGFLAPTLGVNIWLLSIGAMVMAIAGDSVGYYFGKKVGPALFKREDSFLFHKKHLLKAEDFFEKHGPRSIVLARFIPVVRTFTPIIAGAGKMNYRVFLTYNIIGGSLWGGGLTLLGYFLGSFIPNIDQYLIPVVILIIIISFIPVVIGVIQEMKK